MKDAICRLCLVDLDPDDSGCTVLNDQFRKALDIVFPFKIRLEEELPVHTCKQCSWNVLDFQSYSEIVQRNQEKLETELLRNVQNRSTQEGDALSTEAAVNDNIDEGSATRDLETFNSSQPSQEKDPSSVNTSHTDNDRSLDDAKIAYDVHSDNERSTLLDEGSDIILEEYLITPNELEDLNYTTIEAAKDRLSVEDEDHCSGTDEPAQKRKKMSSLECATVRENIAVSDSYHTLSNPPKGADHASNGDASAKHICEQCEKQFVTKWHLEYHKQEHIMVDCPFCKKSIPAKTLQSHVASHQDALRCNTCNIKFISQRDFKQHRSDCIKRSLDQT